jgi:hypothetical protein
MTNATAEQPMPTFMDHHFLQFWLWAFITDAEAFLLASHEFRSLIRGSIQIPNGADQRRFGKMRLELAKYHLVSTMGSLLRHLKRVQPLFPAIHSSWEKAEHLQKEGKDLRDMIEHADQYMAGEGRRQDQFFREAAGVATNLPGDRPGVADATSMIVDNNGHWLGGRLNVERALAEVRLIWADALNIPPPLSRPRRPHGKSRI